MLIPSTQTPRCGCTLFEKTPLHTTVVGSSFIICIEHNNIDCYPFDPILTHKCCEAKSNSLFWPDFLHCVQNLTSQDFRVHWRLLRSQWILVLHILLEAFNPNPPIYKLNKKNNKIQFSISLWMWNYWQYFPFVHTNDKLCRLIYIEIGF